MSVAAAWSLTGRLDGPPLLPPPEVEERLRALGSPLGVDVVALLAERAADAGFLRSGPVTCGGAGRLVRAADDWVAVNLPRDDDLGAVAAWLEADPAAAPWELVDALVPSTPAARLVERAELLGLPVARLAEVAPPAQPVVSTLLDGAGAPSERPPVVVDLSSLWAGPLCTRLLAERGARVVKVESVTRPDGARRGPRAFFERMTAGKELVQVDLRGPELAELLATADVVVEGSRPRALAQLGITPEGIRPRVWASITGYGRDRNRVAFGDDAAVAGGLVADDGTGPCFVADAAADPLTGIAAAVAVTRALEAGGRWLIDAAMAGVAAWVTGHEARQRWRPAPE